MFNKVSSRQEATKAVQQAQTADLLFSNPITPAMLKDVTKALSEALRGSAYLTLILVKHK